MARKTAVLDPPADPVAQRRAVIGRVLDRRAPERTRSYANVDGGPPATIRIPADTAVTPPASLGQWCDDRTMAAFGSRTRLNPAEQAAHSILESMRTADPRVVRDAVGTAGKGLDGHLKYLVAGVLADWRGKAISPALDVASAAALEARKLGWDVQPRRQRRGPEPVSQMPGERVT